QCVRTCLSCGAHVRFTLSIRSVYLNWPSPCKLFSLSLHDALPIYPCPRICDDRQRHRNRRLGGWYHCDGGGHSRKLQYPAQCMGDRKSTRLNSSHVAISYAVFCLKKKSLPRQRIRQYTTYRVQGDR